MGRGHETADVEELALAAAVEYLAAQHSLGARLPRDKLSAILRLYIRNALGLGGSTQARHVTVPPAEIGAECLCPVSIVAVGSGASHRAAEHPYRLWQRDAFRQLGLQHPDWALVRKEALAFARFICNQGSVDGVATRRRVLSGDLALYTQYVALLREDLRASAAAVEAELQRRGPEAAVCKWLAMGLLAQEPNGARKCTPTNRLRTLFLAEPVSPDEPDHTASR